MGCPPKVLIADDSPLVLRMIEKLLTGAGFETVLARDGLEAVEKAFLAPVDLVVLDVSMPRMNGYQACRLLKSEAATRHVPVVILTTKDQAGDRFWGAETGADYYLTKDAEPQRVLELVRNVLADESRRRRPEPEPARAQMGSADVLSRVNELLDRRLYEATILSEMGRIARGVGDLDQTFLSVMALVSRVTDFTLGALALVEGDQLELLIAVQRPASDAVVAEAKSRLLESVAREWKGRSAPSVRARLFTPKSGATGPQETALSGFAAFPIRTGSQLSGLLGLAGRALVRLSDETGRFLEKVANQAYIVTENSRLVQRLEQLADHDGLTELPNHRHTLELLRRECERVGRYAGGVSVLMLDIDHFKDVNEIHGHLAGDTVLREVARLLAAGVRAVDVVGRYGGEEFLAILPQTEIEDARRLAERLRQAVASHGVAAEAGEVRVTLSIGAARYPAEGIASADELVRAAESALQRARQAGRNSVA